MPTPSADVHAGRLSVLLQALTFSVADVLKDLHPLVHENISTSKHDSSEMGRRKSTISRGLPTSPPAIVNSLLHYCLFFQRKSKKDNSLCLAELCLHPNAAQYSIVRVFAFKSNIKEKQINCTSQPR